MFSTSKPGTSVSRLAALNLRRDQDADFTLYCQGTTILAHSFLLASTSEYFEMALSNDWLEKKEKKMELKECSAEVLHVAVNFMYGINIPEGFKEYDELLRLADLFMMDNLKEVIDERLAKALTKSSYLEISQLAELYSHTNLITKCGDFVFEEFGDSDEINWEEMVKLPKVMAAFGKRAMKGKKNRVATKYFKKKEDFASEELYGEYVMQNVGKGSVVRLLENIHLFGDLMGLVMASVGDLATVDSKNVGTSSLKVIFARTGWEKTIPGKSFEIVESPLCNFLIDNS